MPECANGDGYNSQHNKGVTLEESHLKDFGSGRRCAHHSAIVDVLHLPSTTYDLASLGGISAKP